MASRSPHLDSGRGDDLEMRLPTAAVAGLHSFRSANDDQVPCPRHYSCSLAFGDAVFTISAHQCSLLHGRLATSDWASCRILHKFDGSSPTTASCR